MTSVIKGLAARRAELLKERAEVVVFPGWTDPVLALELAPVEHATLRSIMRPVERASEGMKADREHYAHAATVATACRGVLIGEGEGQARLDLTNTDLCAEFGVTGTDPDPADIIIAMSLADGDIARLAAEVMKISGYEDTELDRVVVGESRAGRSGRRR